VAEGRDPVALDGRRQGRSLSRIFAAGFATQTSNPKTAIVYASIFTALLPADRPGWLAPAVLPLIFAVEAGWYALVAFVFSSERPRQRYLRSKAWIDRMAACVMGALGVKLAAEIR
jgi:threonine/homoserine/homoserine lactone efflux protein